jgi:hypothetical protein
MGFRRAGGLSPLCSSSGGGGGGGLSCSQGLRGASPCVSPPRPTSARCSRPPSVRPLSFGKLVEIHFNQTHHICGARIRTYLLEKSRVVGRWGLGLGWAGLGCAGLGWAAPGWAGLGWAGLGWAGLGLISCEIELRGRLECGHIGSVQGPVGRPGARWPKAASLHRRRSPCSCRRARRPTHARASTGPPATGRALLPHLLPARARRRQPPARGAAAAVQA